jgi:hypothetical protein
MDILFLLFYYVSLVPDVIWAALIASGVTLLGVYFTNRHYTKQQTAQLTHEKSENESDRKLELRKSIYLAVAEQLTVANQHLMTLSDVDLANTNPAERLQEFFKSTAKASMVASDETATVLNTLVMTFSEAFFALLPELIPIQKLRIEANIQNGFYERYQGEAQRILASMTQFNEEAKANSQIWNALSNNLNFNVEQSAKAAEARNVANKNLYRLKQDYSKKSFVWLKSVADATPAVLVSIRKEMDISTDINAYKDELERRFVRMSELLEGAFKKLNNEFGLPD